MLPTSTSTTPAVSRISGIRKPPPISTSSPRDTSTARPNAIVRRASTRAAAPLLLTSAPPAPVNSRRRAVQWSYREPRAPASRSYSRLAYPRATLAIASSADSARGARPRLVCRITPVPLMTARSEGVADTRRRSSTPAAYSRGSSTPLGRAPGSTADPFPSPISRRTRSSSVRRCWTTSALGWASRTPTNASDSRSRSRDGIRRRASLTL